jgi:hypothetical protein
VLDLVGTEDRAILYIFDSIEVNIQWDNVPFERVIFTNVDVIAHHRAVLTGTAQAESYRRIGTDAREIHSTVPRASDSIDAGIQRLVEHDTNVTLRTGTSEAHKQEGQKTWNGKRGEIVSRQRSSGEKPSSDERDPMHNNLLDETWLEWEHWPLTCAFLTNPTEP